MTITTLLNSAILLLLLFNTIYAAPNSTNLPTSVTWAFGGIGTRVKGARLVKIPGPAARDDSSRGYPAWYFRSVLMGTQFSLFIRLAPGVYDVSLGYRGDVASCVLTSAGSTQGAHVFQVTLNNQRLYRGGYDISRACRSVQVDTFQTIVVPSALMSNMITVKFKAWKGEASIAFISAVRKCNPPSTLDEFQRDPKANHLAHAVPGNYPAAVDRKKKGFVTFYLDGSGSHTHFSTTNGSGSVIAYQWRNVRTGQVLSTSESFKYDFPVGTTKLKLTVFDSACSYHSAFTDITVTEIQQPGPYCYYYRSSIPTWPAPGEESLLKWPRPVFGLASGVKASTFDFDQRKNDRTFPFKAPGNKLLPFYVRCVFLVDHSTIPAISDITAGGKAKQQNVMRYGVVNRLSGHVKLYREGQLILDTTNRTYLTEVPAETGVASYELMYKYEDVTKSPFTQLRINEAVPRSLSHDQAAVLPILRAIDPKSASPLGGARIRLSGYGLYLPLSVRFGTSVSVAANRAGATSTQVFANIPETTDSSALIGTVKVRVVSEENKASNAQNMEFFSVSSSMCDNVKFDNTELKTTAGKPILSLNQPTSIAIGPDQKLYIGTRKGRVQVIDYDRERLIVQNMCHSEVLSDPRWRHRSGKPSNRTILGITFNPKDTVPRPYVSVSTLFWGRANQIDTKNPLRWANGGVELLMPATAQTRRKDQLQCLQHQKTVVSGLPVSDGDHSINEMVFTQSGDLLIAVGGYTNSGLPGIRLSGLWESYFSASVVIAKLSKGNTFNGNIPYTTPANPRTARPKAGYTDVSLYATGVRNLFSLTMSRKGYIFGVDMGPNCEYGNVSTSCAQYDEQFAASRQRVYSIPGQVIVDRRASPAECKYGPGRSDKLLRIQRGKYYGHSNLQRGRPEECIWIDPQTNKPPIKSMTTPSNYMQPLAMLPSAKTGVVEYNANLFCGRVRGDLLLSQNSGRSSWRARMSPNGLSVVGKPYDFLQLGGIRITENVHGDLLFPKYWERHGHGVFVNRPRTSQKGRGFHVVGAYPWRHPKSGGTTMMVGGWGFDSTVKVFVGDSECTLVGSATVTDTEISCKVPARPGTTSAKPYNVRVVMNGEEKVLDNSVLYMNV